VRYYQQQAADFFTPATNFAQTMEFNSSDYRLSKYDALSAGLKFNVQLGNYTLVLSGERYRTSRSSNPAMIDFTRLSAGIDYTF
jgi:hypothetical protein